MTRTTLISVASLVACVAAGASVATNCALAQQAAATRVTSSDATSRFIALGVSKSVVIDFPTDIADALVADKGVANVIVRSKRRVYVIGLALGQTNIFFYDARGRQIEALDITVTSNAQPHDLETYPFPANVVLVFNGNKEKGTVTIVPLSCTPIGCIDGSKPGSDQVPGTQNINVTGNAAALVSAGK
jgi:Flp pilus assembly secretin CpaC